MMNENEIRHLTRRRFLEKAGLGAGSVALTALLHEQGILSASAPPQSPLVVRKPPSTARAKSVIWLFQTGSPSQVDTFDYKPMLAKRNGRSLLARILRLDFSPPAVSALAHPSSSTSTVKVELTSPKSYLTSPVMLMT